MAVSAQGSAPSTARAPRLLFQAPSLPLAGLFVWCLRPHPHGPQVIPWPAPCFISTFSVFLSKLLPVWKPHFFHLSLCPLPHCPPWLRRRTLLARRASPSSLPAGWLLQHPVFPLGRRELSQVSLGFPSNDRVYSVFAPKPDVQSYWEV